MKIGIIYDVVNLSSGECVKAGSTEKTLSQSWKTSPYLRGRDRFVGFGLIEVLRIVQHPQEPDDLFTWRLRVKEQQHILKCGYLNSSHSLGNKILPLSGSPDVATLSAIGGRLGGRTTASIPGHLSRAGKIGGKTPTEKKSVNSKMRFLERGHYWVTKEGCILGGQRGGKAMSSVDSKIRSGYAIPKERRLRGLRNSLFVRQGKAICRVLGLPILDENVVGSKP